MNTLYYLRFNNYYNRIIKKYDTVLDYLDNAEVLATKTRINFNPGDGVLTTQVVNWDKDNETHPDYLLVADDSGDMILSRWFIIESKRTSGTQYQQTLKRDTIVDNYEDVVAAPLFVEKATVSASDPAIFNKENMTYNQIKKSETILKDNSNCAWLVGYVARDYNEAVTFDISTYYDEEYSSITMYPYYAYANTKNINSGFNGNSIIYQYNVRLVEPLSYGGPSRYYSIGISSDKSIIYQESTSVLPTTETYSYPYPITINNYINTIKLRLETLDFPNLTNNYHPSGFNVVSPTIYEQLSGERNKIIKIGNYFYKVIANNLQNQTIKYQYPTTTDTPNIFGAKLNGLVQTYQFPCAGIVKTSPIEFRLEQIQQSNALKAKLDLSATRTHCTDQPYDIFCMPYVDGMKFYGPGNEVVSVSSKTNNLAIATGLASLSSVVYDLQILPYCPLLQVNETSYDLSKYGASDYKLIKTEDGLTTVGVVMWCSRSQFTFNIQYYLDIPDIKISNECDMYRLCSPNYNGIFEFSPAKNIQPGNTVAINYFKIDCAYKPFTPYIHIAPDFKGLYGSDFSDARGLICAGDFSITSTTDKWAEYQINNKNYLASFDRNIETQELQNKMSRFSDIANIPTMAANGAIIGGIKGGIAGTVLGAGAGLLDAGINLSANETLRRDALDLTKDQFGFQLENIQALPNSLSKVSSINQNNKIFPFLEFYTCTDEEKKALKNKLKYNGMTIGRIGTISDFQLPEVSYIKGKLIRIEGALDYHEVNDLANELNQGVFI